MSAMQNYAKFDSRIAEESISQNSISYDSFGGVSNSYYDPTNSLLDLFGNTIDRIFWLLGGVLGVAMFIVGVLAFFYFIFILITLYKKGADGAGKEIKGTTKLIYSKVESFLVYVWSLIRGFFVYFWNRKKLLTLLVLLVVGYNFAHSAIYGNSMIVRIDKIEPGYVGVDLKENKIIEPGYHVYSPIKSTYFLSPTATFDFEIVEVTANTIEELGVILDYRVGFKIIDDKRLDLYNKYGPKNIRLVSSDIVMPRLLETIKAVIKDYSFKDISKRHSEIKDITITEANNVLASIGIEIQDINILDIRLPDSYIKSKEDLLKSENELKLAQAELEKQRKENERRLEKAENDKNIKIIEAEGIKEYNRIIKEESITDSMLEMKKLENDRLKIEKWDGKLPTSTAGEIDFLK